MPPRKRTKSRDRRPVADNIADLRLEHGWTQKQLAGKLKTGLSNVARIETGIYPPTLDIIEKLMAIFKISADDLIRPQNNLTAKQKELRDTHRQLDALEHEKQRAVAQLVTALTMNFPATVVFENMTLPRTLPEDGHLTGHIPGLPERGGK